LKEIIKTKKKQNFFNIHFQQRASWQQEKPFGQHRNGQHSLVVACRRIKRCHVEMRLHAIADVGIEMDMKGNI
jgi:hypothetical protein